jgi:hypothetical protein
MASPKCQEHLSKQSVTPWSRTGSTLCYDGATGKMGILGSDRHQAAPVVDNQKMLRRW